VQIHKSKEEENNNELDIISVFSSKAKVIDFMQFLIVETDKFTSENKDKERYAPLVWWNQKSRSILFQRAWVDRCVIEYITNYRYICDEQSEAIVIDLFKRATKDISKIMRRMVYVSIFGDIFHITSKTFRGACTTKNLYQHQHLLKYKEMIVEFTNVPFYIEHLVELLHDGSMGVEMEKLIEKLVKLEKGWDNEVIIFGSKKSSNYIDKNAIFPVVPFRLKID